MRAVVVVAVLVFVAGACTDDADPPLDLPALIERLTKAGVSVHDRAPGPGAMSLPLIDETPHYFFFGGTRIGVYEFRSEERAREIAGGISPDGGTISVDLGDGAMIMTSLDRPAAYYSRGRLLVVYDRFDFDRTLTRALEAILGPPIGGYPR